MNVAGNAKLGAELTDPHGGLIHEMKARLVAGSLSADPAAVAAALTEQRCLLGPQGIEALAQVICEEYLGNDPIAAYVQDPAVTDVLINGCATAWVERSGKLEQIENTFTDEEAVRSYAQRLAVRAGRRVDDASPFVDARLPDGTRLHAILPPLAVEGHHDQPSNSPPPGVHAHRSSTPSARSRMRPSACSPNLWRNASLS